MPIFSRILPPTICLIFLALGAGFRLDGSATASSSINAGNLQITPANGVLAFDFPWTATAFTEALDSAGGFDQEFSSVDDAATQAGSSTPFSSGTAVSSALAYTAGAASGVNLPSVPASASSRARGAFLGMFHIAGVPGPVNVDFSADFTYSHVLQTLNAISASSEVAFSLTVDGGQTPLFLNNLLTLGPTGSASASSSGTLTGSLTLATNTPYSLYAEVDSESFGYDTPEPSTWLLVLAGLAGIVLRRRSPGWPRLTGLAAVLLTGSLALQAKYDGGDPPKCTECERSCPSCTEGTDISPTEGTMMQRLEFPGLQGGMGGGLNFGLNYNSYNADGSRSMMDTGLGYGWTHSFNGLLFNQRGSMFRYGPDGRITKFQAGPGSTFTPGPGYFDVLVRNPDSSFTLTRKDKTSYRFESVPDTPFLLAGPVYRLTKITDRNNNVITLTYAGGNLVKITDAYGRFLTLTYNGANRLTSVTDPLGHTTTFTYDPTGRDLRVVTDAAGKTTKFGYNALHQITQKVDRDGRIFNYQYAGGLPVAVLDGTSTLIYRFSNPANWATDATALAGTLTRVYVPSTTTKTDGLGRQWKYTYNSNGQVTSFQAPDGATTSYAYDPATLMVSSQTDANGHTTQYGYDALGNLIKVTDALAHVAAYTYEPVYNQMTSMTDANGRVTTYQYDGLGNRIKTIDPLGLIRTATYDSHGNVLTETDMRGNTTTYQYDSEGNRIKAVDALAETTTNSYDAAGNALTTTDPRGNTTTYQYDALNRRIQQTDALGGVATTSYDGEGNRTQATDASGHTTSYLYDQRSRPAKIINPQGGTISSTYDANNNRTAMTDQNGRTTRYTYDVRNRLTQTTDALNKADKTSYDATGNIVTRTDSNGHATTYVYDALDRMTQMTDAVGAVTRYAYDATGLAGCPQCTGPAAGSSNVTKLTDANGKVTHYKYDGLDRRIIQIRKEGDTADSIDGSDAVTRYGYDGNGNSTSLTEANGNAATYVYDAVNRRTQSTNAAGDVTSYTYDAAGNVQTRTSANGNVITYTYDALNRRTQAVDSQAPVVSYSYDAVGNRLSMADGLGNSTTYTYDSLDRMVTVKDAMGETTTFVYDAVGNQLKKTDREGRSTTSVYDGVNRRTSTTDALGNVTQFQYDGVGNLLKLTDARGNATTFTYDNVNRVIRQQSPGPLPNLRTYSYDGAGNPLTRVDELGRTTTYSYNDLYFLTKRSYPASAADNFTYDLSGRALSAGKAGWVTTFAYDGANRVVQTTQNGKAVGYQFNVAGRTRKVTYPGGRVITEGYDFRNYLLQSNDGAAPPIVNYTYDAASRMVSRGYRNGVVATSTYNANNWLLSFDHKLGGTRIVGFAYDRDREGNSKDEKKLHAPSLSEAYAYDTTYRLIDYKVGTLVGSTVPVPATQTQYNLDQTGNWNSKTTDAVVQNRTHNAANQTTADGAAALLHEGTGNLINDGTMLYVHDEENRLTMVKRKSDGFVLGQYQYDALGRRVRRVDAFGTETRYFYDDWRAIEEQSPSGATLATYVFGASADEAVTMERGGQAYYYHQNVLQSTHGLTNSSGVLIEAYRYDAYGNPVRYLPGGNGTIDFGGDDVILAGAKSFYDNPLLFTGQRFDPESGLHHYKRRSYSSALGRFLERDPAWASDVRRRQNTGITAAATSPEVREQTNLYAYALDNPTNRTDPLGESSAAVGFRGEKQEQDDDGNPVTRYLVDFYIYDPCCEAVNLIQTVRYRAARGGSYTEWDVDDGRVGGLSNKSKNAPFYNETNQTANFVHKNITDKQGQTHTLDMPTSTMRDRPGSVLGRVWEFEVCAMCVAGRNAGLVYICSRWRAETAWYGTDKYVSVGEPGGPSDDWKKAAGAALAASDKGVKLK